MILYRKLKTELIILQIYFPFNIEAGTLTASVTVSSGEDPDPNAICLGIQNVQNNRADVLFGAGIPGVIYKVSIILSILGDTYVESAHLAISDDWADYLPNQYVPVPPTITLPELYGELILRSALYPIDGPTHKESAILALNSVRVRTDILLAYPTRDKESAVFTLNSIRVFSNTVQASFLEKESALFVLDSITVKSAILGDTTEKESALLDVNSITVKTEPNGFMVDKESATLAINSITVTTV